MTNYIALLRAVNVGGTGKLSMNDLRRMCVEAGFDHVDTYIASGNVIFQSTLSSANVKSKIEAKLLAYAGKPVRVAVRTAQEMQTVLDENPFPKKPPNYSMVFFLDEPPPPDALNHAAGAANEELSLGRREIYVFYANGMGRSKLKIPAAINGTARNINTITKLVSLTSAMSQ